MLFWIVAACLSAALAAMVVAPLLRPAEAEDAAGPVPEEAAHLAVYRDQLAELERDRARGFISAEDAEAAKLEVSRRLLVAAGKQAKAAETAKPPRRPTKVLAVVLAVLVPAGALGLYLPYGQPDEPAQPLAQRDLSVSEDATLVAEAQELERRLQERPDDIPAWVALGQTYGALGRYEQAVAAYGRAVGLTDGDITITSAYAEALVAASNNTVTEEARAAFQRVVAANPQDPRARYYLGLSRLQAGDLEGALQRWQALAADTPADAPWRPMVEDQIRETARRMGIDPFAAVPAPPAGAPRGPGQADMAAAAGMAPEELEAMIGGMVDQLAARLEAEPDDLEGWLRLGQAYRVLGEPARAAEALAQAVTLAPDDLPALTSYAVALFEAEGGDRPPEAMVQVLHRILALDPDDPRALWFLGFDAAADERRDEAAAYWSRLLAQMEPGSEEHRAVTRQIEALAGEGG